MIKKLCIPLKRPPIPGEGRDLQIIELARLVGEIIGYQVRIVLIPAIPTAPPRNCWTSAV